jgi:hypothetical protein
MIYVEAPNKFDKSTHRDLNSVFLGGSISNAKDWQLKLANELNDINCVVFNPRRKSYDIADPVNGIIQIGWEFDFLPFADIDVFYFSEETLAPITLFEYGAALERNHNPWMDDAQSIYAYCEPGYLRKFDVATQTKLYIESFKRRRGIIEKEWEYQPNKYDVSYFESYDLFLNRLRNRLLINQI